jgi:hypothetical protein
MAVKSRLQDGRLLLAGEADERLPVIQDGLLAHFPFDGTQFGHSSIDYGKSIIDHREWYDVTLDNPGAVVTTDFNDFSSGNSITLATDPFGTTTRVWKTSTSSDPTYPSQGGIYVNTQPIDATKLYRMSFWEYRADNNSCTYGRYYFGCNGYGSTNGVYYKYIGGSLTTNPYFYSCAHTTGVCTDGKWVLMVGHIWPAGTIQSPDDHEDSGIWDVTGAKIRDINYDFIWHPTSTTGRPRTLAIYHGDVSGMVHYTAYPRFDLCDGTEPTLEELIAGEGNFIGPETNTNNTLNYDGLSVEQSTTNMISYGNFSNKNLGDSQSLSSWGDNITTASYVSDNPLNINSLSAKMVCSASGTGGSYFNTNANSLTLTEGNTYTYSFYAKAENPATVSGHIMSLNRNSDNYYIVQPSIALTKEWKKYSYTKTIGSGEEGLYQTRHIIYDVNTVWITGLQLEGKEFASAFTVGSRSASGGFSIPNLVTTGNYTINFKCKVNTNVGDTGSYQTIMCMGNYYTDNSWTIMDQGGSYVTGNQCLIRRGDSSEWSWAGGYFTSPSNFQNENVYTLVRDATNYKVYSNGVYVTSLAHLSTTMQDLLWVGSRESGGSVISSTIKDLSIYNRALTDDEVFALATAKTSLSDNLIVDGIIEQEEWIHIYGGPHFYLSDEDPHDAIDYEYDPNVYGEINFDMMMIKPRYFGDTDDLPFAIGTFTETCVLKEKYRYYTNYLDGLPDDGSSGARLLCHSASDGLLDIESDTINMGHTYGNSWRRYADMWYTGGTGSYLGQYSTYGFVTSDWGASYADNYTTEAEMLNNTLIESGNGLTPLQSCMIDVYIKAGTGTVLEKAITENSTKIKREVLEGVI